MKKNLLLLFCTCVFISCENKKELELQNREKALILREEQLADKEADYKSLLIFRDSVIALKDTVNTTAESLKEWPKNIQGIWMIIRVIGINDVQRQC